MESLDDLTMTQEKFDKLNDELTYLNMLQSLEFDKEREKRIKELEKQLEGY